MQDRPGCGLLGVHDNGIEVRSSIRQYLFDIGLRLEGTSIAFGTRRVFAITDRRGPDPQAVERIDARPIAELFPAVVPDDEITGELCTGALIGNWVVR